MYVFIYSCMFFHQPSKIINQQSLIWRMINVSAGWFTWHSVLADPKPALTALMIRAAALVPLCSWKYGLVNDSSKPIETRSVSMTPPVSSAHISPAVAAETVWEPERFLKSHSVLIKHKELHQLHLHPVTAQSCPAASTKPLYGIRPLGFFPWMISECFLSCGPERFCDLDWVSVFVMCLRELERETKRLLWPPNALLSGGIVFVSRPPVVMHELRRRLAVR